MKIALLDSGLGLLAAAAAVRRLRPDADLVLSSDPGGMPWGPRTPQDITARALACALAAAEQRPDALIVACNTASVHALARLRAELEPEIPVVGTVPAVKPAAGAGGPVAIWATPATTGSAYQRRLIADFGNGAPITGVPCHGLADAVEQGDEEAIDTALAAAAELTPTGVRTIVLGCTHYELVTGRIREATSGSATGQSGDRRSVLLGSADAVAAQALRRAGARPAPEAAAAGGLTVLLGGTPGELPAAALTYAEGRLLTAASPARN
ncbi:aspartate/glutamate racemase family protein [Streptomyces sp. N2-109]|uniref:Aspartate/glutamate racemase family protein n=1 Tax=Streptomyces gossypii TaxID=2883101 RepID=A0ABT2K338_9ACTN|nr:aspartate/glutamate racemase family protein [Streptomyces gossypii]MCT2594584.1 aspartate/glutamate racemase family protein [Streptomyces gossypii]